MGAIFGRTPPSAPGISPEQIAREKKAEADAKARQIRLDEQTAITGKREAEVAARAKKEKETEDKRKRQETSARRRGLRGSRALFGGGGFGGFPDDGGSGGRGLL